MSWECNNSENNCHYDPLINQYGCINIFGEALEFGEFNVNITVLATHELSWATGPEEITYILPLSILPNSINNQPNHEPLFISNAEYYWDTDPGEGNATPLIATDGDYNSAIEYIFSDNLSIPDTGYHSFNIRFRDGFNQWGPVFTKSIYVYPNTFSSGISLSLAEYFWDNDPGEGNGTVLAAFDGDFNSSIEQIFSNNINIPDTGYHSFNIRFKDGNENWGSVFTKSIYIYPNTFNSGVSLSLAEYFWDNDPGEGNGIVLAAFDGDFNSSIEQIFSNNLNIPDTGYHSFNIRFKDGNEVWGSVFTKSIYVHPNTFNSGVSLSLAEYFWDNDPGEGNGTVLAAFDGDFNSSIENFLTDFVNTTDTGFHILNIRLKDNNNFWGPLYKRSIYFTPIVLGCMDSIAYNFLDSANLDNGSCLYCLPSEDNSWQVDTSGVCGCLDVLACNYNPEALYDNQSCVYDSFSSIDTTVCDSFDWNGQTYTTSGTYSYITSNSSGCDSVMTLNLEVYSILNNFIINDESSFCDGVVITQTNGGAGSYTYQWNQNGVTTNTIVNLCSGYNNLVTIDSFGCQSQDTIFVGPELYGCMDETACNYDSFANLNSDDCEYPDMFYDCEGNCISDFDNDGVCNELEIFGCTDFDAPNFNSSATENDGSCIVCNIQVNYVFSNSATESSCNGILGFNFIDLDNEYSIYVNDQLLNSNFSNNICYGYNNIYITDSLGCEFNETVFMNSNSINGCTDQAAYNFNELANTDDGSCVYNCTAPTGLFVNNIIHNRVTFNWSEQVTPPSHYMIRYRPVGTNSWTVMTAGPVNENPFLGTSRTRYFMQPNTSYEWNIRSRDIDSNLSIICQSPWSETSYYSTLPLCPNLENQNVIAEANWVTFIADVPEGDWGVWQSKGKIKEVGTSSFRYVIGSSNGEINSTKGNFSPNTGYEWHTKAWCTGNINNIGNPDPMYHSGWGDFHAFSTQDLCDKLPTNLITSGVANNSFSFITMSWDTPTSGEPDHYFLELTNLTTGQVWAWNNIPGNSNSKTKYNLTSGDDYSWRIRGACGTNGTTWATIFSEPVYYTLGGARFDNDIVSDLNVYPNPSRDLFNISFSSDELQSISIRVVNVIGEEIFKQELIDFDGTYTHELDMSKKSKGVYFLEISSEKGTVNSKMILQ